MDSSLNRELLMLPVNLYQAALAIRLELTRKLTSEFGEEFTADYWFLLDELFKHGQLSQSHLAELTHRNQASVSRTISCMERIDLVHRIPDAFDKRRELIAPTETAIKFKPQAEQLVLEAVGKVMDELKPIELMELNRMLGVAFRRTNN